MDAVHKTIGQGFQAVARFQHLYLPEPFRSMPLLHLATSAVVVLSGLFAAYYVISSFFARRRLSQFHGPFLASFSYLWLALWSISGRSYRKFMSLHQKHGKLVRIGPNELITSDIDLIKIMGSARGTWARSDWYNSGRVHPFDDTILNVTDTAVHDKFRHGLIPGYSGRDNLSLEGDINDQLVSLVCAIRRKYVSTREKTHPLDFVKMSQYFTVDTMTQISFGKPFGCLEADSDRNEILETVEGFVVWGEITANWPLMQTLLSYNFFYRYLALGLAYNIDRFNRLAEKIVADRWQLGEKASEHKDMLGSFMRKGYSRRECELQVPTQLTAGTETTATAIRGTLLHLLTSPTAYRKLQVEIDDGIKRGVISNPISFKEAKEMSYVTAVVYEGLRMHPPFTGLLMKRTPPEGYTYSDGRVIPGGTFIGHSIWQAMRDKDLFGDDSDIFRPDRFLEADDATRAKMRSAVDCVFGYGRWQCMGRPISVMELHKVFVELLRRFDIQIMRPYKPIKTFNVNLFLQSDMMVRITERNIPENERENGSFMTVAA